VVRVGIHSSNRLVGTGHKVLLSYWRSWADAELETA
jgi:hypothetical protein